MRHIVKRYFALTHSDRKWLHTAVSVLFTAFVVIGKFVLAVFGGVFFFVSGVLSLFMLLAKYFCLRGNRAGDENIETYNHIIGIFVLLAGIQYAIYMGRLLYSNADTVKYSMEMGIAIATVSFAELIAAIVSHIRTHGDNAFLKHIKKINLCSALTAMVLTEAAIMSFAHAGDNRFTDAVFGLCVGAVISVIGVYIIFSDRISLCGHEKNRYVRVKSGNDSVRDTLEISLYRSSVFPEIRFIGRINGDFCDGRIVKGKSPIFQWNPFLLVLVCILSEILIFPYLIGLFAVNIRHHRLLQVLDAEMCRRGFVRDGGCLSSCARQCP